MDAAFGESTASDQIHPQIQRPRRTARFSKISKNGIVHVSNPAETAAKFAVRLTASICKCG